MTDIRFYHLQSQTLEQALPALLAKALEKGSRVVIRTGDAKEAERLNELLWTYDPNSFLPHGSAKDGHAADQPVYLAGSDENPNGADVLILTGGAGSARMDEFKLCCDMFDGRDENAVSGARARWKAYKDAGHSVTYLQQTPRGGWETKS